MDYVARAKALLVGKARVGALVVLPLAVAVNHANAGVISLPTGNVTCETNINGSGGACFASANQLTPYNGVAGVGFQLTSPGNSIDVPFGQISVTITSTGVMTGPSGGKISAGTVFTQSYNLGADNVFSDSYLFLTLEDLTTSTILFTDNIWAGFSGSGIYSGYFTETLAADAPVDDTYRLSFGVYASGGGGSPDDLRLTLPQDALNMATAPQSAGAGTPEPSTLGFGAFGLALTGFWRRLRQKRGADPE